MSGNRYLTPVAVTINNDGTLTLDANVNANAVTWTADGSASTGYTWRNIESSKYIALDSDQFLVTSSTALAWLQQNGAFNNQIDSDGYFYLTYASAGKYTTSRTAGQIRLYKLIEG